MDRITVYYLGRAGTGPADTCVERNRFGRVLDDSHIDFADFISYDLAWTTLHDAGGQAILMKFDMPEEAYIKYCSPQKLIPDACATQDLSETMVAICDYAILDNGSMGSFYAKDLLIGLGYDLNDLAGFRSNDWTFWKDFNGRLDAGSIIGE